MISQINIQNFKFILKIILNYSYEITNIILFISILSLIISIIQQKTIQWVFSITASLVTTFQIISLYITGTFIGYSFFVHFNLRDIFSLTNLFLFPFIIVSIVSIALTITISKLSSFFRNNSFFKKKRHLVGLMVGILPLMCFNDGLLNSLIDLTLTLKPNYANFEKAKNKLGLENYTSPNNLTANAGKNIIIISLESFERGFLSKKKEHLTPNLNLLKEKWSYLDVNQNTGGEWTSGSLYTWLTGFPAHFGIQGNSIFQKSFDTKITSIGHILNKANYDITYLLSDSKYSGTEDMLYTFGIKQIIDRKDLLTKYTLAKSSQVHDYDIFQEAKEIVLSKSYNNNPYAIFISTISTHFPNGIYDVRMEKYITPQQTKLETMIAAVDYMIGDFIGFLKKNNILDNTSVFIFPDHLKMGDASILNGTGERSLYVISNENKKSTLKNMQPPLSQIDLPNIILNGAKINHNALFLTDIIHSDKQTFLSNNINSIKEFNIAGLQRITDSLSFFSKISYLNTSLDSLFVLNYYSYLKDTTRYIAHAGGEINGVSYTNSLESLNSNYKLGFRLFELDIIKTSDNKLVAAHDWLHWSKITNYKGKIPPTLREFKKLKIHNKYSPLSLEDINLWFDRHADAILVTDKINQPRFFASQFCDKNRLMMELFSLDAIKEATETGIRSSIVSQNVIDELGYQKLNKLLDLKISDIAVSRRFIKYNKRFLRKLKYHGIHTYVYHINFDKGIDEKYVLENEIEYIYGMYADKWPNSLIK